MIGFDALLAVTRHPGLCHLPFVLETPNELEGYALEIRCIREGRMDAGCGLGL
jgi:deoxyribonuclease-4